MTGPVASVSTGSGPGEGAGGALPAAQALPLRQRLLESRLFLVTGRIVIVAALLLVWEIGSGRFLPKALMSSPSAIVSKLLQWIADGTLWTHLAATLTATGAGYLLGASAGILTGLAFALAPLLDRIASPFVTGLYALPKVALAPLFVIFLGIGIESKIALVAVTVYFLLLYNTVDGARDLDGDITAGFRLMGASEREIAFKIIIPGIAPWIFSGLRIGVRYAFTAAILGELIAGNKGVGFLIESSAGHYNASGVFAGVLVLVICSVAITELLARTEASTLQWRL